MEGKGFEKRTKSKLIFLSAQPSRPLRTEKPRTVLCDVQMHLGLQQTVRLSSKWLISGYLKCSKPSPSKSVNMRFQRSGKSATKPASSACVEKKRENFLLSELLSLIKKIIPYASKKTFHIDGIGDDGEEIR